ncbi:MAG: hypothetical protein JWP34_2221 [Massilia sp.]|jgi:hypothetical protein|nr:hypothetical protein [Massilia sp.]
MNRPLLVLLLLVAVTGCTKKQESAGYAEAQASKAPSGAASRYLAYEHSISIDAEEQKVAAIFEAGQAACRGASADSCVVLESHIATGRSPSASLRIRAKPSGIQKLIATFAKQGEIIGQSATAEDLASPIEDATKKLAMLNDYRSKLEALLARANSDVDALIKLNRELAQVQSELEAMTGRHAHLMQRVETEVLNVSIGSIRSQSFWRPIAASLSDFGTNLSQGISTAITGIAYMIPWGIALLFLAWVSKKLWRRRARLQANAS